MKVSLLAASCAVFLFSVIFPAASFPDDSDLVANPVNWATLGMLEGLDPGLSAARRPTVEAALREYPGSVEVFLLALLNEGYLESLWASPGRSCGPLDPGPAFQSFSGRGGYYESTPGPQTIPAATRGSSYRGYMYGYTSPLILDLDGNGVPGVDGLRWKPHPGLDLLGGNLVPFDINGDGFQELTEWVDGSDGLLAESSRPRSGRDLFGTAGGWKDGFQKLSVRDQDGDGLVAGAELKGLFVWKDTNRNGAADDGEISETVELGITAIRLPPIGEPTGTFTREETTGTVWDWWPSYTLAMKLDPSPVSDQDPPPIHLDARIVPADLVPLPRLLAVSAAGWVSRQDLAMAGIDWSTVIIAGLSPDGSRLLLLDRGVGSTQIAGGDGCVLWSIERDAKGLRALPIPLPVSSLVQLVFESLGSVLAIGENGARLLRVDLTSGERSILLEQVPGAAGFRGGDRAWRSGGEVYLTGYFHDADQEARNECIASFGGGSEDPTISYRADLDAMRSCVRGLGDLVMEYLSSPRLGFYIVRTKDMVLSLAVCQDGDARILQQSVRMGVLAASGSRVLFQVENPMLPFVPPVFVLDVETGEIFALGSGYYSYPYLEGGGRVAVMTDIDWENGRMTFLSGRVLPDASLEPFLATSGIGALRVSKDGSTYAYLGPEGLKIGAVPGGEKVFLRGNADGSRIPAVPAQAIDLSDAVFLLYYLYLGGDLPPCMEAADVNDDGGIDISDVIKIIAHLFLEDGALPSPWPEPGPDPKPGNLDCKVSPVD